jgi:hypothetical protein
MKIHLNLKKILILIINFLNQAAHQKAKAKVQAKNLQVVTRFFLRENKDMEKDLQIHKKKILISQDRKEAKSTSLLNKKLNL